MNIWGRIEGERHRGNASLSTSFTDAETDTWKMQIGVDRALHEGANGNALVGGFTAHYGKANTGVRSFFGDGRIVTQSQPARLFWQSMVVSISPLAWLQCHHSIRQAPICFS